MLKFDLILVGAVAVYAPGPVPSLGGGLVLDVPVPVQVFGLPGPATGGVYRATTDDAIALYGRVEPAEPRYFEIDSATARVTNARTGEEVARGEAEVDGHQVRYLAQDLPAGIYDVAFDLVSGSLTQLPSPPIRLLIRPASGQP